MKYPRVLVVTSGRINAADPTNNGLLLRNLFAGWPRECLAQLYSGGDNGDNGFFGHYYRLAPADRRFGHLFYKLKTRVQKEIAATISVSDSRVHMPNKVALFKTLGKRLMVDTGLCEMIFRPRMSRNMRKWVKQFRPDIIFAQGYCLSFAWLPIMLKKETGVKIAFLTTDDWPTFLYSGLLGEPVILTWLIRPVVKRSVSRLFSAVDIPFGFGQPMADEYSVRYGKTFITLSHTDDPQRFEDSIPQRIHPPAIITILAIGSFNRFRWPLLLDANECCALLEKRGIQARIAVISYGMDPEGARELAKAGYLELLEDPGNGMLPVYLKGADILLLAEGFDEGFVSAIRFSVSSKAHLFMFSKRPIIVYAHQHTGICKYASLARWARVVSVRDVQVLTDSIQDLLTNENEARALVSRAYQIGRKYHLREENQAKFLKALSYNV